MLVGLRVTENTNENDNDVFEQVENEMAIVGGDEGMHNRVLPNAATREAPSINRTKGRTACTAENGYKRVFAL